MENNSPSSPASRGKKIATAASIAAFVLLLVFLAVYVGGPFVKTLRDPAAFRTWVNARGLWGKVLFVGMTALQVIVAFIPGEPFELAAGYAFGAVWGTVLVWIGLVLGSTIVFLFVRKVGVKAVEVFFPRERIDSLKFLKDEKKLNAAAFLLFFIPGTPKDLLTYAAGLTKIRLLPWVLITSVARLPSIVTSTISGQRAGRTALCSRRRRVRRHGAAQRRGSAALPRGGAQARVSGSGARAFRAAACGRSFGRRGNGFQQRSLVSCRDSVARIIHRRFRPRHAVNGGFFCTGLQAFRRF